jgi:excisionase family DNA binding protein
MLPEELRMARILNTKQAAEKLQVKPLTIRKYLRKGLIPGKRLGREWRIVETDLELFLRGNILTKSATHLSGSGAEANRTDWRALSSDERRARIEAVMSRYEHVPGAVDRFLAEKRAETEAEEHRFDERHKA